MKLKKFIFSAGGAFLGLLLSFIQEKEMSYEVEEQVNKALEERGIVAECENANICTSEKTQDS